MLKPLLRASCYERGPGFFARLGRLSLFDDRLEFRGAVFGIPGEWLGMLGRRVECELQRIDKVRTVPAKRFHFMSGIPRLDILTVDGHQYRFQIPKAEEWESAILTEIKKKSTLP